MYLRITCCHLYTVLGDTVKKILSLSILVLILALGCDNTEKERDALLSNAASLEQSGKHAEAREQAQKALTLDPAATQGYLLVARSFVKEGNTDEALKNYTLVYERTPDNLEALENLSRLNLVKGELALAESFANKAAAISPASLEVKIVTAGVHLRKKEYDKAKPILEEVRATAPDNEEVAIGLATIALNQSAPKEAKKILEDTLSAQKTPSTAVLSMLTNIAIEANDMAGAEQYLIRLMEAHPSDESLPLQLANIYAASGKAKEAPGLLRRYLEQRPDAISVRTRLAEISIADGNYDEALKIVDGAQQQTPKIRLLRAGVLTQSGKVAESIPLLREIIADSTTDNETISAAYLGLASIFMQQNKLAEAEAELTALLTRDPKNTQALFMRSGLFFNRRDFEKALKDMEAVVENSPNDPSAFLGLADVLNGSGDSARAEQIISDVIVRFPSYGQAYITMANLQMLQNKPEAALMTLDIGKSAVQSNIDIILNRADILVALKRFDDARKELEELAKSRSEYKVPALMRLAEIEMSRKRFTAATQIFENVLKENPEAQAAVEGYLHALVSAKKTKEALAFADKRRKSRPDDLLAHYLYGEIALVNKNVPEAEKSFRKALDLNPSWEQPLARLATIYSSQNKITEAMKLCESLLEKNPDAVSPAVLLGILLEQKGDLDGAEARYRKVLEVHKDNLLAANNLAYLLSRHKNTKERLQEAETLAMNASISSAPATFDTLGWIQYQLGKDDEAEKNIRKAAEELKENSTIAYHLAATLAKSKNKDKRKEALEILQRITDAKAPAFAQMSDARKLLLKLDPKAAQATQQNNAQGASTRQK